MKGHDWASFSLPGILQNRQVKERDEADIPRCPEILKCDEITSMGRLDKPSSRGQWEDRDEVKIISLFSLSEHPNSSPLFSAFAKFLLEEFKLLDKSYLTKTCTAPVERSKSPMLSLLHKRGSGCAEGQLGLEKTAF